MKKIIYHLNQISGLATDWAFIDIDLLRRVEMYFNQHLSSDERCVEEQKDFDWFSGSQSETHKKSFGTLSTLLPRLDSNLLVCIHTIRGDKRKFYILFGFEALRGFVCSSNFRVDYDEILIFAVNSTALSWSVWNR